MFPSGMNETKVGGQDKTRGLFDHGEGDAGSNLNQR